MTNSKTAWLIDDDELCNFLTAKVLESNKFCSITRSFVNGQEALSELQASLEQGEFPNFIFLDINMPVLDGWSFLDSYRKFPEAIKQKCTLYILSSSIDEEDAKRAKIHEEVRDFISKPLNKMDLEVIKFQTQK